jgi:hypothetical protein
LGPVEGAIIGYFGGWLGMTVTAGAFLMSFTSCTGALLLFFGERRPSLRSTMCDPVGLYVGWETSRVAG